MAEALDLVADMTRTRDRSLVDATLVASFLDLLPVKKATLWRMLGDPGEEERWQRCVAQKQGDLVAEADWTHLEGGELIECEVLPLHTRSFREIVVIQEACDEGHRIFLPMASEREVEGVVELMADAPLSSEQLRVASGVLRIHRHFSSLLDYSERDTLTGLLNRKSFDETFLKATVFEARTQFANSAEQERRRPHQRRHWLGVIDVDRFKLVNDQFGHLIGDEVLVLVARIMRNTFRYHDRLYRFGGEEFVVLLTAPDEEHAMAGMERMRVNMEQFQFPRVGRVTISVGFTDVRAGDTPQAAFERADRAVYYAKEHGRNQVQSHSALVGAGRLDADDDNVGDVELF